mgnify:CR=1 FL=1
MEKLAPVIASKKLDLTSRRRKFKRDYLNLLYMLPVIIGILGFTLAPMIMALIYSFCTMDLLDPQFTLGAPSFQYYSYAFSEGFSEMGKAYLITFRQTILVSGIGFVGSYILALILNQKIRGMGAFKIIYYLPCLIPGLAGSLLWTGLTKETGLFNQILLSIGLPKYGFYSRNETILPTMILLSGWGFSGNMIMWLAQFKNIPNELYEEANLSGAGRFRKLFKITIPMSTSMIFYLLIMNIIGSLQSFGYYTQFVDSGKTLDELKFVGILIYETAYTHYNISYACALSWILFGVIGILTIIIFTTSKKWVYYAEDN